MELITLRIDSKPSQTHHGMPYPLLVSQKEMLCFEPCPYSVGILNTLLEIKSYFRTPLLKLLLNKYVISMIVTSTL